MSDHPDFWLFTARAFLSLCAVLGVVTAFGLFETWRLTMRDGPGPAAGVLILVMVVLMVSGLFARVAYTGVFPNPSVETTK